MHLKYALATWSFSQTQNEAVVSDCHDFVVRITYTTLCYILLHTHTTLTAMVATRGAYDVTYRHIVINITILASAKSPTLNVQHSQCTVAILVDSLSQNTTVVKHVLELNLVIHDLSTCIALHSLIRKGILKFVSCVNPQPDANVSIHVALGRDCEHVVFLVLPVPCYHFA
jgi:hypothetical protein